MLWPDTWRTTGGRVWRGLGWRLRHVLSRAAERISVGGLRLALRVRMTGHLPRPLTLSLERKVIGGAGYLPFDSALYLERNPDVLQAGQEPLAHYLRYGWIEGRDPNGWLDERRYRRQAGLTPRDRISGLGHYLALGRARGLGPALGRGETAPAAGRTPESREREAARAAAALERLLRARPPGGKPEVDVIVPVHSGRAETLTCLASVLEATCETGFALVVVDDCGPDPQLRGDLALLERRGLIDLLVQPSNRGFVASINAGMRRNPDRDVIWLNADTEVWDGWIDRLRAAALAAPDIATVTPLTNNGTICSYPRFDTDNFEPLEIGWDALDRLAARVNAGRTVEAPTCVGFCTYVRRDALTAVGELDEAAFGRGYGEENDFSQRAIRWGWRNVIAGNVFVWHAGQTSFGDARAERVEAALRVVERRNPGYRRAVRDFVADDPVAPLRRTLDLARIARRIGVQVSPGDRTRRTVLIVTHGRGGGTAQHVAEEVARLGSEGAGVVIMTGGSAGSDSVALSHPDIGHLPAMAALPLGGRSFAELVRQLRVTEVHLHHLADFGRDAARRFGWLMDALDLPFDFVVHDYLPVCPRINLADSAGMYCGEPDEVGCRRCLVRRRSEYGAPEIGRWRNDYGTLLAMARRVRVPDRDVAARLVRYFPGLSNVHVRPHQRIGRPVRPIRAASQVGARALRIATIGAIGPVKGFEVLLDLAGEIRARDAAVELTVIGYTRNDDSARAAGIAVTGAYDNARVAEAIEKADPDVVLIPSIWPETFCYTLSHAMACGRPVAGFDIGAIGTRLRDSDAGLVLPLTLARDPTALLEALIGFAQRGGVEALDLAAG